jgi:hypothetical protein
MLDSMNGSSFSNRRLLLAGGLRQIDPDMRKQYQSLPRLGSRWQRLGISSHSTEVRRISFLMPLVLAQLQAVEGRRSKLSGV